MTYVNPSFIPNCRLLAYLGQIYGSHDLFFDNGISCKITDDLCQLIARQAGHTGLEAWLVHLWVGFGLRLEFRVQKFV